jgi:rhodanese-related sulfurtransferase
LLRALDPEKILRVVGQGGLLIDLRAVDDYLARHVRGSIPLLFERGPGLSGRARDLLPLDARLVLIEDGTSDLEDAAASFRGKGFDVAGYLKSDQAEAPPLQTVSTPDVSINYRDARLVLLDVADPGTLDRPEGTILIPAETLWQQARELDPGSMLGILAGWGVRAASAIGILENLGFQNLTFVRTRARGAKPPMAGAGMFRIGGPP